MSLRSFNKRRVGLAGKRRVRWAYIPTERQEEFHRCPKRYKLYGGAMGGGKTMALCAEAIKLSLRYPGNRGYFCRHQLVDFKRSTLVTFERQCPPELIRMHYRDDRLIVFRNGSEILYGGLGGEEDLERIKSTEFGWVGIDEATETYLEMFQLLDSRLRWKLPDGGYPRFRIFLASNPEPGWVKERFVDRLPADHAFIPALPKDNPYLPPNYDAGLRKNFPNEWVKRYLDGSWDVFEGQVYKEFDKAVHVYRDIEMGQWWERFRVIDHGYTNPTCCLWIAVDHDGAMWIYDEHYERFMTVAEHAPVIMRKQPDFAGLTLCDPSMFASNQQREGKPWSIADEYRLHGISCIKPYGETGWMPEAAGIMLVKQRLKARTIHVHESCVNTIAEFTKLRWMPARANARAIRNEPEQVIDRDNHAMDCIRMACMWRPQGSVPPAPPPDTQSLHYAIMKHKGLVGLPFYAGWN